LPAKGENRLTETKKAIVPGTRAERIAALLTARFAPGALSITDDSAQHAGHAGAKGISGGETHFSIAMCAAEFAGLSRVARARLVHAALAAELAGSLHALALKLRAPGEE
jgi:BolA protein